MVSHFSQNLFKSDREKCNYTELKLHVIPHTGPQISLVQSPMFCNPDGSAKIDLEEGKDLSKVEYLNYL